MEPRLTDIRESEALQYLGYRGGEIPPEIREALHRCRETVLKTARPRAVWRKFRYLPDGSLEGTDFRPLGRDVRELLRESSHVILFGATLGAEVETLLRRAQIRNMTDAVMLDSCASAAIENVCDNLCADLEQEVEGYLTDRFSPGYGDMPFSQQPELCRALELQKRIGVHDIEIHTNICGMGGEPTMDELLEAADEIERGAKLTNDLRSLHLSIEEKF